MYCDIWSQFDTLSITGLNSRLLLSLIISSLISSLSSSSRQTALPLFFLFLPSSLLPFFRRPLLHSSASFLPRSLPRYHRRNSIKAQSFAACNNDFPDRRPSVGELWLISASWRTHGKSVFYLTRDPSNHLLAAGRSSSCQPFTRVDFVVHSSSP